MKSLWLLGLAGCWSSSSKPVVADAPASKPVVAEAPAPARPVVVKPPPPPYAMSARTLKALAAEKLAGNVLVPYDATLYASKTTVRSDGKPGRGRPAAMQVIADHGDVVEVSTAPAKDCAEAWDQPYQLRVFVARAKLGVRTKADVTKTFSDGTAIAIDRGAPIDITDDGPSWGTTGLGPSFTPSEDQFALATPPLATPAALPPPPGERLVCDGGPKTEAEWRAARQQAREAEARARQAEIERRRAEWEAQRAEREAKRKAEAGKRKPGKAKPGAMNPDDVARMAELLTDTSSESGSLSRRDYMGDLYEDRFPQWCGIGDPDRDSFTTPTTKTPAPTIDRRPVSWPSYSTASNDWVVRTNGKFLADVGYTCARVRMAVVPEAVKSRGGGMGIGGGGTQVKVWVPAPGPVTWLDGSPAGKYSGTKQYKTFVEEANRICVNVPGVAEMVCHDKAKAKATVASPWRAE